jgi:hypothetical protein
MGFHKIEAKVVSGEGAGEPSHDGGSEAASTYKQVKEQVKKNLMKRKTPVTIR